MSKGFAPPKPKVERYQRYTAELKKVFRTDTSELLIGTATIKIPKRLHDPLRLETNRTVWDCLVEACAYHLLFLAESERRGVNTVFAFYPTKENPFPEPCARVSYVPWKEKYSASGEPKECDDRTLDIIEKAAQQCQIEINWLALPKA